MITQLVLVLDPATGIIVGNAYGMAEMVTDGSAKFPAVHVGGNDFVKPATDASGTWSYWRLIGQKQEAYDTRSSCGGIKMTYSLRWVAMLDRDGPCADLSSTLLGASNSIRSAAKAIRTATGVGNAQIVGITPSQDSDQVYRLELGAAKMKALPTSRMMASLDVTIVLYGDETCFTGCAELTSVTPGTKCEIIQGMNVPNIWDCMTEIQQAEVCADHCGDGGDVEIVDQNMNVLDTVPCGGQYEVILADAIVDPLTATADVIVDPL